MISEILLIKQVMKICLEQFSFAKAKNSTLFSRFQSYREMDDRFFP